MSLRPNRAGAAGAAPGGYGGYNAGAGSYTTPGATSGYRAAAPSSGGANYYQSPGAAAPSPYGAAASAGGGYSNGAYGTGYNAGGSSGSGYSAGSGYGGGGGGGHSNSSYGGYTGGGAYGGSSASDSFKDKPKKRKSTANSGGSMLAMACAVLGFLFVVSTLHFRGQRNKLLAELKASNVQEALEQYKATLDDLSAARYEKREASKAEKRLTNNVNRLESDLSKCRVEKEKMDQKHDEVTQTLVEHRETTGEHAEYLENRDAAWANSVEVLQSYTQRESRRQALERFGSGPHHVRFSVLLPSDRERRPRHFVVECAPLDQMPHAVHLFLEQVMHGLWNNAWFYLNGPHVIQGGPQADEGGGEGGSAAVNRFKELSLDTLAFPEYSAEFPHVKYTLGFTGRPGGPDFYINKMNNTEAHGPGGQHQHHLEEFADPCFAKVIDGFDTLDLIYTEQTFPDGHEWGWFFVHPVHIVGATLLEQTMPPPEEANGKVDLSKEPENQNPFPEKPLHVTKLAEAEHQVVP